MFTLIGVNVRRQQRRPDPQQTGQQRRPEGAAPAPAPSASSPAAQLHLLIYLFVGNVYPRSIQSEKAPRLILSLVDRATPTRSESVSPEPREV